MKAPSPAEGREKVEGLLKQSQFLGNTGKNWEALQSLEQAFAEASRSLIPELIPELTLQKARISYQLGNQEEAFTLAQSLINRNVEDSITVRALTIIGISKAETDSIDIAEEYLLKAIDLSHELGETLALALALHCLALCVHLPRGRFHLALTTMEQAGYLKTQAHYPDWGLPFIRVYINLMNGQRQAARQALDELLPLIDPGSRLAGGYYYFWARLDMEEGELQRAEEYLRLCLRIANQTGAIDLNIWARNGYSRLFRLRNQAPLALGWAEDAVRYAIRNHHRHLEGVTLIELAQARWLLGSQIVAVETLMTARKILTDIGDAYNMALIMLLQAIWEDQTGHPDAVKDWLEAGQYLLDFGYLQFLEQERPIAFPFLAKQARSPDKAVQTIADALLEKLADFPPQALKIFGLGQFAVWQGNHRIPDHLWDRRKAGLLFRFLLLKPHFSALRDEVIDCLWPESNLDAGIKLLHQATSTLRHILEPNLPDKFPSRYLRMESERVVLTLPQGSKIDFEEFEHLLPIAVESKNSRLLEKALLLYIDDLFPMDRYEDWAVDHREKVAELYERGLLALGKSYYEGEVYYQALDCARRVIKRNNANQDAVALGMQSCIKLDDAPHAIQFYLNLEQTLREIYDISPRQDLKRLIQELKQR